MAKINVNGKKAVFLTFIAISITAAFVIIFTPTAINLGESLPVVETRVSNVNEYVEDLENVYLEQTLEATGTKTIISLVEYMKAENEFLSNFNDSFGEVLLTGEIGGTPIDDVTGQNIMSGNTYNDWLERIKEVAHDSFKVQTNFTVNSVNVYQLRPWFVTAEADITFSVNSSTASWSKNVVITTNIDIERFEDPYYAVNTDNNYANMINQSPADFDEWNLEKVRSHIGNGTYIHFEDSKAPTFIMRFTNTSTNSSCCGIESIVNPNKLSQPDQVESYPDYLFFNHTYRDRCEDLFNVTSLWPEYEPVKMEFEHIALYNLTGESYEAAC